MTQKETIKRFLIYICSEMITRTSPLIYIL